MALQISGLKKSEVGLLLFLLQCETRAKEKTPDKNLTILEGMAEADVLYCT